LAFPVFRLGFGDEAGNVAKLAQKSMRMGFASMPRGSPNSSRAPDSPEVLQRHTFGPCL